MRSYLPVIFAVCVACGSSPDQGGDGGPTPDGGPSSDSGSQSDGGTTGNDGGGGDSGVAPTGKIVFVIPMENQDFTAIIGNNTDAPYINGTLVKNYASASNFQDELPLSIPSEPHYVWMESGANQFTDHTFTTDSDPSGTNSTNSTQHLSTQLDSAKISWMSYQEGITQGTCPVSSISGTFFAAKHDPFVFFQDVSGSTPSKTTQHCIDHHKPLSALSGDLTNNAVASFNFVTPNLCNDMHGASGCPQSNTDAANIAAGDTWLKNNLPAIITYALAHNGYVFVIWDEGSATNLIPFIAIGQHSIAGHVSTVKYTHSSLLKSEEEILGVSALSTVTSANDFADMFDQGTFP